MKLTKHTIPQARNYQCDKCKENIAVVCRCRECHMIGINAIKEQLLKDVETMVDFYKDSEHPINEVITFIKYNLWGMKL